MQKSIITENFFATLAKSLLLPKLEKELGSAITKMEEEKDLASTLASLKYWANKADADLKYVCKKNPNSPLCKEKGKK